MCRLVFLLPILAMGCFGSSTLSDAGPADASDSPDVPGLDAGPPPPDAFVFDTNPPPFDGGSPMDAGPPPDGGPPDAGPPPFDGGPPPTDAGPPPFDAGPVPSLEEACAGLCDALLGCGFVDDPGECTMGCVMYGSSSPSCEPAAAAAFACGQTLDCMMLFSFFMGERDGPCAMEFSLLDAECPSLAP